MNETASERIDQLQASIVELEQQLAAEKARADYEKIWAEDLAKQICEMEDALGFKHDCIGAHGEFIPTMGPWKERVRDLIAKEGELGDAIARADRAEEIVATQQKQIERLIEGRNAEGLLKLKAEKERDETQAACNRLRDEKLDALEKALKAEAAYAEMRNVLGLVDYLMAPIETKNAFQHALSSDCGNGWLSPIVREKVRDALETARDALNEVVAYGSCDCDLLHGDVCIACQCTHVLAPVEEALALLDGKQSK